MHFLESLVVLLAASAFVVFLLGRFRIPSIVGFLIAGIIVGPYGLRLISDIQNVELLAEIGVVLLMFTIGLEFSIKKLLSLKKAVFRGGSVQIILTTFVVAFFSKTFMSYNMNQAIFNGFLVSLSSTAIIMKMLMDRAEINAPHGRISVGILLFQDLCVVPFVLLVPILADHGGSAQEIVLTMAKALAVLGAVFIASMWAVPHMLHSVVSSRSRELFVITIILLCIGTAFLTSKLGLSLALGAFLAGVIISESEYSLQAISDILPFKESFTGIFFVSIGMLMDLGFFAENLLMILLVVVLIMFVKTLTVFAASLAAGRPPRVSVMSGLYLNQIGEFSFVLALAGKSAGLMSEPVYQVFISASVLTMLLTPFIVKAAPAFSGWMISRPLLKRLESIKTSTLNVEFPPSKSDHVIIVGFGINGSNLAKVLKNSDISYVILEMNPTTVRKFREKGEPIYYGDGTSVEILHKMGIHSAKVLVIAISDAAATRRTLQIAKHENPNLYAVVRTKYMAEVEDLLSLGADEVIPEEFETSIEIFSIVLNRYHVPVNLISKHAANIRMNSYGMFRAVEAPSSDTFDHRKFLKSIQTSTYYVSNESFAAGKSIKQLALRSATGATILSIQRGSEIINNPEPDTVIKPQDIMLLMGEKEHLDEAVCYLG
ncbi:MAG: cation:proton antiporter [Nitrospiraceae bacterium]|nr:cation:proton antiporter [Nitrospiraceae bacterium]